MSPMIKPLMSGWVIWGMVLMGLGVGFARNLPPRVPGGMSVVVYSVKPDRIAQFEACLRDYGMILGELLREGKLDAQGRATMTICAFSSRPRNAWGRIGARSIL